MASSMYLRVLLSNSLRKSISTASLRHTSQDAARTKPGSVVKDVPGLSAACITPSTGELGPGASKTGEYKNPEYFSYHSVSYFEAEIEMSKYRCPQPSSKRKK